MDPLNTEKTIPTIIDHLRKTSSERDYVDAQNVLMDRERNLKSDMKNLENELVTAREEIRLMKEIQSLEEFEKTKRQEDLETLKFQKIEAERAAAFHKKRVDDPELRVKTMEKNIANMLDVRVGDIDKLVSAMEKEEGDTTIS